jgi:hypothetical protein
VAIQNINVGTVPDDGTGDSLVVAGGKINENFDFMYEEGVYNPTVVPEASGSVTLDATNRTLSYTRVGNLVTVTGVLVIASVSSPVGGTLGVSLPFAVADLAGLAGRFITTMWNLYGGVLTTQRGTVLEGTSTLLVQGTAATWQAGDNLWFGLSYRRGA